MKKTVKVMLSCILLGCMLFVSGISVFAEANAAGGVDIDRIDASEWMAALPDDAFVSALNIPGTHDSGLSLARDGFGTFARCQTLTITGQLEAGVRFFDLRLRYAGNPKKVGTPDEIRQLYVCHGQGTFCCDGYIMVGEKGNQKKVNYTYEAILDEMAAFLEKHPDETIFYFVRNEYMTGEEKNSDKEADVDLNCCYIDVLEYDEQQLTERLKKEGKREDMFSVLSSDNDYSEFYNKKLGDCRGRMFRFGNEYGFGSMMNEKKFNDWDAAYNDKWNNIKPLFDSAPVQTLFVAKTQKYTDEQAEKNNPAGNTFRAAWTSCTGLYTYDENGNRTWNNVGLETIDIFDWFDDGVGFPTGGEEAVKMNNLLMNYRYDWGAYYGWIAMDMVTADLARLIFSTNDFNVQQTVISKKEKTYIKDIEGFCDVSYDDAVQRCYAKGFTPLQSRVNDNGRACFDINPDGYPIVLGYTTTTNPEEAITDIVGRYDSNEPGNYKKVIVNNSLYNHFTRGSDWSSEDTYLFVSRSKGKAPIRELEIMYGKDAGVADGMVSRDLDGDRPVGSKQTFNLQQGVTMDGKAVFIGLKMTREETANNFGTVFGSGNIAVVICCIVILVLAVLLMLEVRKNRKLTRDAVKENGIGNTDKEKEHQ